MRHVSKQLPKNKVVKESDVFSEKDHVIEKELEQTDDISKLQAIFEKEFSVEAIQKELPEDAQKYPEIAQTVSHTLLDRVAEMLVQFSHKKEEGDTVVIKFAGKYAVFIFHIVRIEMKVVGIVLRIVLKVIATAIGQAGGLSLKAAVPVVLAAAPAAPLLLSGREYKKDIEDMTDEEKNNIVREFHKLPLKYWRYYFESPEVRHIGPIAQEWHKHFASAGPVYTIPLQDMLGVLMVTAQRQEIDTEKLRAEVRELRAKIK